MKMNRSTPLLVALPVLAIAFAGFLPSRADEQSGRIARAIASELPREHLSRRAIDEALSRQMLENYLDSLDPDRVYFLAGDIETFNRRGSQIGEDLKKGDVAFAFDVFERFRERVRDRHAHTGRLLADGFDLAVDETYRWRRKDQPWCADEAAWDELWRLRIKNEYLRRVVARSLAEKDDAEKDDGEAAPESPAPDAVPRGAEDDGDDEGSYADMTPEAFILNRYVQHLHIIEDSDEDWILHKYLSAFARAFDPHCDYMSPAAAEDFEIEMKLSLVGIGALLRPEDGTARIVSLIPGGPAASDESENRLRPGDKIIAVAQGDEPSVSILHWPLYRAVRLIRGEVGSRVVLTVIPAADPTGATTKTVELVRDEVKLEEREARSRIETVTDPTSGRELLIGVITLPTFYADITGNRFSPDYKSSSRDVAAILRTMRERNVDGIVLDLRGNGGGSLAESVLMTGLFIETGPVVLVRQRRAVSILPDNDPTIAYGGPLAVMVNRISASASEILAAALQDYGRAIIIGDSKTHGKGSVQTIAALGRGDKMGSIKVTNALFYRISGASTQLRGVQPDIVIPSAFDFMEFGEDFLPNPLEWTSVKPVMYSPFDDLSEVLPALRGISEDRRAADERYQAYRSLLDRIEEMNTTSEISLHFETRMERSRAEKELLDIQNRLMERGASDKDAPPDLVEIETLRILADLIRLRSPAPPAGPEDEQEPARELPLPEEIPDWNRAQSHP